MNSTNQVQKKNSKSKSRSNVLRTSKADGMLNDDIPTDPLPNKRNQIKISDIKAQQMVDVESDNQEILTPEVQQAAGLCFHIQQSQIREDAALVPTTGSVWTRLHGHGQMPNKVKTTKNDNQDLIDMGCIDSEEDEIIPLVVVKKKAPMSATLYKRQRSNSNNSKGKINNDIQYSYLNTESNLKFIGSKQRPVMSAINRKKSENDKIEQEVNKDIENSDTESIGELKEEEKEQEEIEQDKNQVQEETSPYKLKQNSEIRQIIQPLTPKNNKSLTIKKKINLLRNQKSQKSIDKAQTILKAYSISPPPKNLSIENRITSSSQLIKLYTNKNQNTQEPKTNKIEVLKINNDVSEDQKTKTPTQKEPSSATTVKSPITILKQNFTSKSIVSKISEKKNANRGKTIDFSKSFQNMGILQKKQQQLINQVTLPLSDQPGIICQINSIENYMRRAINRIGWVAVEQQQQTKFHVKFDVKDLDEKIKNYQFYNHFTENREITTKAGICKNLWTLCSKESELKVSNFFPRCYDLSDAKQVDSFVQDFNQTSIKSILKLYASEFMKEQRTMEVYEEYQTNKAKYKQPRVYKQWFKQQYSSLDVDANSETTKQVLLAAKACKIFYNQDYNSKNTSKMQQQIIDKLVEFHQTLPNQIEGLQNFHTYQKIKIIKIMKRVERNEQSIDGTQNVWVVKPSYAARGLGIYCANKIKDIIQVGKKSQSRVVQKYIESPLLIKKRKFDLRQWVLVTSWDPLDVYVFDTAYLRLCSKDFSVSELQDVYKHLTNYSIQKTANNDYSESVMQISDFEKQFGQENIWENDLFPKIQDVVFKTLKGLQDSQASDVKTRQFEVYGFDIMFDTDLNPWVIEINLSPACSERTQFLTKMLDDMSFDLVNWVERKLLTNIMPEGEQIICTDELRQKRSSYLKQKEFFDQHKYLNPLEFYKQNDLKNRWVRADESIQEVKNYNQTQIGKETNALAIVCTKADIAYEKKLDLNFRKMESVVLIQKVWRGKLGKIKQRNLIMKNSATLIQSYVRVMFARKQLKYLRLQKHCIIVQCQFRRILAKREAEYLRRVKIHNAKWYVANKIQSQYRRKVAVKLYQQMFLNSKSVLIQKYIKGKLVHAVAKQQLTYVTLLRRIQLFYKRRFKHKNQNAILIQKTIKAFKVYHKVQKLKKIQNGSVVLLKCWNTIQKTIAFKHILKNLMSIKIQCKYRQIQANKIITNLRKEKAKKQIATISINYTSRVNIITMSKYLKYLKFKMDRKADLIKDQMKWYIFSKKIKQIRKIKATIVIQSVCRMRKQLKKFKIIMDKRNKACTIIQSWYKSQKQRIKYNQVIADLKAKLALTKSDKKRSRKAAQMSYNFSIRNMPPIEDEREAMRQQQEIIHMIEYKSNKRPIKNKQHQKIIKNNMAAMHHVPKPSKIEKQIKTLESQFYEKQKENTIKIEKPQNLQSENIIECQIQIQSTKKKVVRVVEKETPIPLPRPTTTTQTNNKLTFAENLKNILHGGNSMRQSFQQSNSQVNLNANLDDDILSGSSSMLLSRQPSNFNDKKQREEFLVNRPVKDPRQQALMKIQAKKQKNNWMIDQDYNDYEQSIQQSNKKRQMTAKEQPEKRTNIYSDHASMVQNALLSNLTVRKKSSGAQGDIRQQLRSQKNQVEQQMPKGIYAISTLDQKIQISGPPKMNKFNQNVQKIGDRIQKKNKKLGNINDVIIIL